MKKRFLALAMGAALTLTTLCGCVPTSASLDDTPQSTTQVTPQIAPQTGSQSGTQSGTSGTQSTTQPVLQSQSGSSTFRTLSSKTNGATLNLLSGDILTFVQNYKVNVTKPYSTNFCNGTTVAKPTPVRIEWEDTEEAYAYTVKLSTKADMSEAKPYSSLTTSLDIEDLFGGTTYYYQVQAHRADKTVQSEVFSFTTANQPRIFDLATIPDESNPGKEYLDSNLRDIGGYYTEDGNYRVKQGIAYRSAEVRIFTQASKNKLIYDLGIKTELAVHNEEKSHLDGFSVENGNYIYTAGPHYVEWAGIAFYGDQSQENLKKELLAFAESANFPILFHCQLGRDRTGTLAFVLGALLGVGYEDLCLDYELAYLTQYGGYGWTGENCVETKFYQFDAMYQFINNGTCINYSKETLTNKYFNPNDKSLAERMATYLKGAIGITDAQIAAIRANMLEEV